MKKEEKTIDHNKYEIVGSRGILIQLDKFESPKESEIFVPKFENYETEGGKVSSKIVDELYKSTGTIVQISKKAEGLLKEEEMDVKIGDSVAVTPGATNAHSWFILNREVPVTNFEGFIVVHPNAIQAKINNNK